MPDERLRILVIDDDDDLTASVAAVLSANGYEVLTATNGEQGLELAFTGHPHLILLDVTMPGMDGHQVCRELQFGYTKDIPVVFLTARTELAHMMEANRSGASAYVTKPFRSDHLLRTISDVLRDASVYRDDITGLPTLANVQVEVQRMLSDHGQLGIIYVSVGGVQALEQLQGFEVVDDVYRVVGQGLQQARGDLIRGEDFISISSLGDAFLIVLSPSRHTGFITEEDLLMVKQRLEKDLLTRLETELESRLLAAIDLFVGSSRLTQSPKIRFKRALLDAIARATQSIEAERDEIRSRLREEFETVMAGEQLTCVFQPIVSLKDFEAIGFELLSRGPRESELHLPDALFDIARNEGRVTELDRLCRRTASRAGEDLPLGCLRFVNTEPLTMFLHSHGDRLRAGVRRGDTVVAPRSDGDRDHGEQRDRRLRPHARHRAQTARPRLPRGDRRRRRRLRRPADDGRDRARLHQARHVAHPRRGRVDRQAAPRAHAARFLPRGRHHAHRRGHRDAQAARHPAGARSLSRAGLPLRPSGL